MAGRVFINYRRGDEPGSTGRLFDRLEQAFTADRLFMDVDHIAPGMDFVRVLEDEVGKCDVLLAVIGKNWIDARDESGNRRLESPNDFVRIEIESALKLGKRIIPVLINDAQMPRADDLPESLKPLSRRNAVRLTHERFKSEAQGLVKILETALAEIEAARALKSEEERRAAEDTLKRKQEEEAARAVEAERQAQERARQQAAQGLSPVEILKAEELANWDFIKGANDATELRNHLARFPGGVTERYARAALEEIVWRELGAATEMEVLQAFVDEFPSGKHTADAARQLGVLKGRADAEREATKRKQWETEAWAKASGEDTKEAYQLFLRDWSGTENAKAARARLREFERRTARSNPERTWIPAAVLLAILVGVGALITGTGTNTGFYTSGKIADNQCRTLTYSQCIETQHCSWTNEYVCSVADRSTMSNQYAPSPIISPSEIADYRKAYEASQRRANTTNDHKSFASSGDEVAISRFCARIKKKGECQKFTTCIWDSAKCDKR